MSASFRQGRDEFPEWVRNAAFLDNLRHSPLPGCYWCEWCFFCNLNRRFFQLDHIIAASRGGPGTIENAIVLCEGCNKSKGANSTPVFGGYAYRFPELNMAPVEFKEEAVSENVRQQWLRTRRDRSHPRLFQATVIPSAHFRKNSAHRAG